MPSPIDGTAGDDFLVGTPGDDVINGLAGSDVIRGLGGSDQLYGGPDDDNIDGGNGDDQLYGEDGNDYLRGGPGDDLIDGGLGFDRVAYANAPSEVTVDLRIQNFTAQDTGGGGHDTIINVENVSGSFFSDTLYGNDNANWIWALGPTNGVTPTNDNLYGNGGNDLLQAGTGDHILDGGSGIDTVSFGQPGDILFAAPDPGNGFGNGIVIDLFAQGAPQDTRQGMMTLISIENVSGSVLDDAMNGNNNANVIAGDAGSDVLSGLGGNDTIYGDGAIGVDSGAARLSGPIATLTADQGTGFDYYDASGNLVFLYTGQELYDAAGAHLVNGVDYVFNPGDTTGSDGVVGNDVIDGGSGDDMLYGGGGNDLLHGGRGASSGNDMLDGGDGDDYLTGGAGNDTIIGGAGIDRAGYFTSTGGVGVSVDLRIVGVAQDTGSQGMDTLTGIENLSGTTFADTLTGDDGDNWLWGSMANFNHVFSSTNNDTISGMGGNDLITVGIGNHLLDGGDDNDTLRFTENGQIAENGITVSLAMQGSAQTTGYGSWTLTNFENLSGGQGNDHLIGDGGANRLTGEGGNDTIEGGGGDDILSGDATYDADTHGLGYSGAARLIFDPDAAPGNDHLDGGAGDDTALFLLAPGAGTLTLGHDGADLLVLRGAETVARISFAGGTVTVEGLNSGVELGTDTLVDIEHISFQIDGGGAPLVVNLSGGVVVDGYVAGGTVFADANNNGVLDAGEAFTTTDASGNFTLGAGSGPLVMFGGTNVDTGLPNLVTLTAPEGSTVVNPLTTLVEILVAGGATPGDAQDAVAAAFGIDTNVDLASFDPLAAPPGDPDALAVQQASAAVVVLVVAGSDAAGGGDGNENAVFDALADAVAGAGGGAVDLTDSSTVTNILTDALPAGTDVSGATQDVNDAATAIDNATSLSQVADAQTAALNNPPEVIVPASFAATEQQALDLKHLMSVADVDAGSGTVTATLSVAYGVIHVEAGTSGVSIVSGNDSASLIVTGTIAQINALLDGDATSVVNYFADTDTPPPSTTITLSVDDGGNSGAGGALTGSDSGTINITAVNDAPVSGGLSSASGSEDDFAIAGTVPAAGDVDSNALTYNLVAGTVKVDGVAAPDSTVAFDSSGNYSYTPVAADQALGDGEAHVVTFDYVASDGSADSAPAAVTITVNGANDTPMLTDFIPSVTFGENLVNATPQLLDGDVTFTDAEGNFDGGTLTLAGLLAEDRAAIRNQGVGAGEIGVSGSDVTFGGIVIGTYAGGIGNTLFVTFNAAATSAAIDALIQNLTYADISDAPTAARVLQLNVTDSDGADLDPLNGAIAFTPYAPGDDPFAFLPSIRANIVHSPSFADLDGDGDADAIIGNNDGLLRAFTNVGGVFTELSGAANPFNGIDVGISAAPCFVDLDGDGDLDLVVGNRAGQLESFRRNADGSFTQLVGAANPFDGVGGGGFYLARPAFLDLDGDGDLDAVIGGFQGELRSFRHNADGSFTELTGGANPFDGIDTGAMATPAAVDFDRDGDMDLVVGDEFGGFRAWRNDGGAFVETVSPLTNQAPGSLYSAPAFADLDGDGDIDAVFGVRYGDVFSSRNDAPLGPQIAINVTPENDAPVISNYDTIIAASGTGPVDLRVAAPTDAEGDPLTITLDHVPGYGTVEYFDGATWVTASNGATLTSAELTTLRYTPPASGEHGGDTIAYSVDDGTTATQGVIDVTAHVVTPDPLLLLFAAADSNTHNPDLYTVGSAGMLHNAALNPPNGSFAGEDGGFVQFGGATYFNAFSSVASFGGLFRMDAAGNAALVDAGGGNYFGNQIGTNAHFTIFAGGLYFAGDAPGGGTEAIRLETDGSFTAYDVNPGHQNMAGANGGFVELDGSLYFSAVTTLTNGNQSPDLIRLDQDGTTTEISTRSAPNAAFGSFAGEDGGFIAFNNALYFNAYDDTLGDTLFRLDAGSTTPVAVGSGTLAHLFGGTDSAFHIFAGSLYFNEFSYASGAESLFKLDPTGTLSEIKYLNSSAALEPLVDAGANGGFIDFGGATFFTARTSDTGLDLFRLDSCGCLEAVDVNLGPADAFDSNLPAHFTIFDGALYFDAYDATGDHLCKLTADGFLQQIALGGSPITQAGLEGGFQQAFGSLFFSAYTPDGYEVVRLEKDGTYTDYDINPGAGANSIVPGDGQTFGLLNANPLAGGAGNDIIAGSAATETLSGGGGNDVLETRGGNDHMAGGDGADLFVLSASGAANIVTLDDYDFLSGDKVDLSALLDAGFGPNSNVSDFVRLFAVEGDIKLQVDLDGAANGANWTDVAILPGGNSPFLDTVEVHFNNADYSLVESFQFDVQTIPLVGGGWAVTWTEASYEQGDVFDNVFGRVFDDGGNQVGGTFQVSASDNGMDDQLNLMTALPNGDFAVVWQACDNEIWTRVYHGNGTPATAPIAVQPPDPDVADVTPGAIITLSNGGYALLWAQADSPANGNGNVYISTFQADGTPVSGPVMVNSAGGHNDNLPLNFAFAAIEEDAQIVPLANGFAVTWVSQRDTGPGGATETSAFVRVFDNAGNPVTGEIQANSVDGGVSSVDGGAFDVHPTLVALGGNDFAVQWESDASGGPERMFARIFDDADYTGGAPIRLDANADPNVLAQTWDATPLVGGGFVALWGEYSTVFPQPSDIHIQVFDANGAIAAGSTPGGLVVNQVAGTGNFPDQVVALAGGGFAILYETYRGGLEKDVYVRTYAADGTPTSGELLVNPADDIREDALAISALPDGSFIVLWSRDDLEPTRLSQDIFARVIGADGTFLSNPILVGSTPSDLSYAAEGSIVEEFRDAVSANGETLVAMIAADSVDSLNFINTLSIARLDRPPLVDLNGAGAGIDDSGTFTEGDAGVGIGSAIAVTLGNLDSMIRGATVAVSDFVTGDQLFVVGTLPTGITIDGSSTNDLLVLTGTASAADYAAALSDVRFRNTGDDPTAGGTQPDRSIGITVEDGALASAPATMTIQVTAVDDAPVVHADAVATNEASTLSGNVFANNGSGADSDVDGPALAVAAVNGSGANVGTQITLASGAHLTLNTNGTFAYDPNHVFDATPAAGSGASNMPAHDSFTYTLAGGGTATVSVTIAGLDSNDSLYGTAGNDTLSGGIGRDVLGGLAGDDMLDGGPGAANEVIGGQGNDTFIVETPGDTLVEQPGEGTDRVLTALSFYSLAGLPNIENLFGLSGGGQMLMGSAGDNVIVGGSGNDQLYGGLGHDVLAGGAGNDLLSGGDGIANEVIGGQGNDTYVVTAAGDTLVELANEGVDKVLTTLSSYTLRDNFENLFFTGTGNFAGTGNLAANTIAGGAGDDRLDGGAGAANELVGGGGNDTYVVTVAGDSIVEQGGGGTDTVETALSGYHLTAANVENLTGTSNAGQTLIGSDIGNVITGGGGNDLLDGGLGADTLIGNGGADFFLFDSTLGGGNVDTIMGFVSGSDRILLDNVIFTQLNEGGLPPSVFVIGTAAGDADDRIIYDNITGALYYDADGNGAGAAIQFATLSGHPALTANDFGVI